MQVILDIKHKNDLEILLPLLNRLGIKIANSNSTNLQNSRKPLSTFIGTLSKTKSEDFDTYLNQTREEWDWV